MSFIELTENKTRRKIMINAAHIAAIEVVDNVTVIRMAGGSPTYFVSEIPQQVLVAIPEATYGK